MAGPAAAILLTASVIHPVYNFRYIVYCIPAAALLIGAALAALGRYAGPVALVVIVLAGLHASWPSAAPMGTTSISATLTAWSPAMSGPGTRC